MAVRSASSMSVRGRAGSTSGRNGGTGTATPCAALAPAWAAGSKLNGPGTQRAGFEVAHIEELQRMSDNDPVARVRRGPGERGRARPAAPRGARRVAVRPPSARRRRCRITRCSLAAGRASSNSCRSSPRGSRSPRHGSLAMMSSPSGVAVRGNTPSSRPSRHTTRCGTARIGTIVHTVSAPVRKPARVGRPASRSASRARTSSRRSPPPAVRLRPCARRPDVAQHAAGLHRLPRVVRCRVGEQRDGAVEGVEPVLQRVRAVQVGEQARQPGHQLGEPAGDVDVGGPDVVQRQRRADEPGVLLGHRDAEQHPVQGGVPGALPHARVDAEAGAPRPVLAPAHAHLDGPVAPRSRSSSERRKRRRTGSVVARSSTSEAVTRPSARRSSVASTPSTGLIYARAAVGEPDAQPLPGVHLRDAVGRRAERRRRAGRTTRRPGT